MKFIAKKLFIASMVSLLLVGGAYADTKGKSHVGPKARPAAYQDVEVANGTNDPYYIYATSYPSGTPYFNYPDYLPGNLGMYLDFAPGDSGVCVVVVRQSDGQRADTGCWGRGSTITLPYYGQAKHSI